MFSQRTIKEKVSFEGIGLHSGESVSMVLSPAPPDTGVVFSLNGVIIRASHENVGDTSYATTLQKDGASIRTVEHLMAALAGLMVDNVYVDITGPEVPIMDGSAWPFVKALKTAGIAEQEASRRYLKIVKPVTVKDGDKSASLLPSPVPRVTYRIDFDHPLISGQDYSIDLDAEGFSENLASARTFGFLKDEEMLRKAGLAKGASLNNAVVVDDSGVLNEGGLRYKDEFVRHKILDAVGDLSLIGMPIIGHFVADKSGHMLNQRLIREVLSRPDCWVVLDGGQACESAPLSLTMTEAIP